MTVSTSTGWNLIRRYSLALSVILSFLLSLAVGGQSAHAASTWFVNIAVGTNTPGCGSAPGAAACQTINYTIASIAAPADTINVAAGTYVENVAVAKTVTITGAGQGSTIVEPAVSDPNCGGIGGGTLCTANNTVFLVQAVNVVIQGLTIEGANPTLAAQGILVGGVKINARNGVVADFNTGTFNNLTVQNVTVNDVYLRGIYATGTANISGILFQNDVVTNVQGDVNGNSVSMMIRQGSGQILTSQISGSPNGTGVDLNFSTGSTVSGNTVSNSSQPIAAANTGLGLVDTLSNNIVSNSPTGIDAFAAYGTVNVTGNTLTNNTLGIVIEGQNDPAERVNVTNNTITGTGAGSTGIQILTGYNYNGFNASNVNATVTDNTVKGAANGLQVDGNGLSTQVATVTATNNLIQNNLTDGILLNGFRSFSGSLNQNCIVGNGFGMLNSETTITIDATNNWWGAPNGPGPVGPGSGDKVSTAVTYVPFLNMVPTSVKNCPAAIFTATPTNTASSTSTTTGTFTTTATATNTTTSTNTATGTSSITGTTSATSSVTGTLSSTPTATTTSTATSSVTGTLSSTPTATTTTTGTLIVPPMTLASVTPNLKVADPHLSKTSDTGLVVPGQKVTFTLTVTNTGTASATNVTITDVLPAPLSYVSASTSQGTVMANGNTIVFTIGTVNPGQVLSLTIVTIVDPKATPPLDVTNTAVLSYSSGTTNGSTTLHITGGTLPATGEHPLDADLRAGLLALPIALLIGLGIVVANRRRTHSS